MNPRKNGSLSEEEQRAIMTGEQKAPGNLGLFGSDERFDLRQLIFKPPQDYIVVYYFSGKTLAGKPFGHIALWDGATYFSYEETKTKDIYKGIPAEKEGIEVLLNEDQTRYGSVQTIVLPLPHDFPTRKKENSKAMEWDRAKYSITSQNCAHFVCAYLHKMGFMPEQTATKPSSAADLARKAGKSAMTTRVLAEEKAFRDMNSQHQQETSQLQKAYLNTIKNDLIQLFNHYELKNIKIPSAIRELQTSLGALEKTTSPLGISTMYFEIKKSMIEKHYDRTWSRSTYLDNFYGTCVAKSINLQKFKPASEKKVEVPENPKESVSEPKQQQLR